MLGQGVEYHTEYWDKPSQLALMATLPAVFERAPLFKPHMPRSNRPWSIMMTNMGSYGWVSDVQGYRYQKHHPVTGDPWPALPDILLQAWDDLTAYPKPPECCLINYYQGPKAKMGLHQDRDEEDLSAPVVSFSIGDSAVFRVGGAQRRGATRSIKLHSGDALVLGGESRLNFHGIDRLLVGSSDILTQALPEVFPEGGRLNFTLRRVSA
ncbi:MAG: alpha-ketoglutarate-dependent dioxygenase AlkB [Parvibaculales bacterium]